MLSTLEKAVRNKCERSTGKVCEGRKLVVEVAVWVQQASLMRNNLKYGSIKLKKVLGVW